MVILLERLSIDFAECVGRQYRAKIGRSSNILAWRKLILVSKL